MMGKDFTMSVQTFKKHIIYLLLIVICSSAYLFYNLGSFSLNHLDEGLFASISYEMEQQNDFAVLSVRGENFFHKQPLRFWFNILAFKYFGVSNYTARFFSAFFALCLVLCVYVLGCIVYERAETGLLSVFILLGSPHFLFERFGRNVEEDSLGIFLVSLFFILAACFAKYKKNLYFYGAFFVLGLVALAKLAFAGFAFLVFLVFIALYPHKISCKKISLGVLMFLMVGLPWHIAQYVIADINFAKIYLAEIFHFLSPAILKSQWASDFFGDELLQRLGGEIKMGAHADVFYYVWVLLIGFFPWVLFSFSGGVPMLVKVKEKIKSLKILPFLWMVLPFVIMLFFYEKRTWRINILFPALALVAADFVLSSFKNKKQMALACVIFAATMLFFYVNQYGIPFYTPSLWAEHYLNMELLPKGKVLSYAFCFPKLLFMAVVLGCCYAISRLNKKSFLKILTVMLLCLSVSLSCFNSFSLVLRQTYKSDMEVITDEVKKIIALDGEVEVSVIADETTKMFHAALTPEFSDYSDAWADYFYLKVLGDKNILVVNTEFERLGSKEKHQVFILDRQEYATFPVDSLKILKETKSYILVKKIKDDK